MINVGAMRVLVFVQYISYIRFKMASTFNATIYINVFFITYTYFIFLSYRFRIDLESIQNRHFLFSYVHAYSRLFMCFFILSFYLRICFHGLRYKRLFVSTNQKPRNSSWHLISTIKSTVGRARNSLRSRPLQWQYYFECLFGNFGCFGKIRQYSSQSETFVVHDRCS